MLRLTKPLVGTEEQEAVNKVLNSGWLAEGEVTRQFETEIARYVGAKYAVATCNCTVALTLCLIAETVKGNVAIPNFTHPATAIAVINAGAHPVLYDVHLNSYNMDLCNYTNGVSIPVSWAGNPLLWYPRSLIIEDAACSLGSSVNGVKTGANFTSCFSLHPRKLITTGEGAVITTNSEELAEKLRELKNFGKKGGNYRFNDVVAAIGLEQLKKLDWIIRRRRETAKGYFELFKGVDGVKVPECIEGHTYQTFAVYLEKGNRDQIITALAKKGIETQIGTYALHLMPQFKNLKRVSKLENSMLLYRNLLALPMAYDLTFDDQKRVVAELKNELA